jgi:hypothetical protein
MIATDLLAEGAGDAPGVKLLAIAVGVLLIIAAIRGMFGKRK